MSYKKISKSAYVPSKIICKSNLKYWRAQHEAAVQEDRHEDAQRAAEAIVYWTNYLAYDEQAAQEQE